MCPTPHPLLFLITETLKYVLIADETCSFSALLQSFLANLFSPYKFRDYFFQLQGKILWPFFEVGLNFNKLV